MKRGFLPLLLVLLFGCAREPVVAVALSAVPGAATVLEVWPWLEGEAAQVPVRFAVDAARESQRLNLRLGTDRTGLLRSGAVQLGIGAFDKDGCLVALAELSGVLGGDDLYLQGALQPATAPCGATRPLLVSVTPTRARTLAQDPMSLRGLGFLPAMAVQIGADLAPQVKVVSPTRASGPLPLLPGRIGDRDVSIGVVGGQPGTAKGALRLLLSNLKMVPTYLQVGRNTLGGSAGWLVAVPRDGGRHDLVLASAFYKPANPAQRPAAIYSGLAPGKELADFRYFPPQAGGTKFAALLDLDGDGRREELVFLTNDTSTVQGSALAFRVTSDGIPALGAPLPVGTKELFPGGEVPRRSGVVLGPSPGTKRETLLALTEGRVLYELGLDAAGQLKTLRSFPDNTFIAPLGQARLAPLQAPGLLFNGGVFLPKLGDTTQLVMGSASTCADLTFADASGDGLSDVLCSTGSTLRYHRNLTPPENERTIVLDAAQTLDCGGIASAEGVAAADLDGDGVAEIACGARVYFPPQGAMGAPGGLFLYQSVGGVLARIGANHAAGLVEDVNAHNVVMADFDGDGRVDVATTYHDAHVLILFNLSE